MHTADLYRRLADEALGLSRAAGDPDTQMRIEEIAYAWSKLARDVERAGPAALKAAARPAAAS